MGYTIDWGSAEVEDEQLSVPVQPDPDFAFLTVFDMVLIESPPPPGAAGWGQVQFASGRIVVSELHLAPTGCARGRWRFDQHHVEDREEGEIRIRLHRNAQLLASSTSAEPQSIV